MWFYTREFSRVPPKAIKSIAWANLLFCMNDNHVEPELFYTNSEIHVSDESFSNENWIENEKKKNSVFDRFLPFKATRPLNLWSLAFFKKLNSKNQD